MTMSAFRGVIISYLDEKMLKKGAVSFLGQERWVEKVF